MARRVIRCAAKVCLLLGAHRVNKRIGLDRLEGWCGDKSQQGGLGPQVQSWLGNGADMPVTPEQLRAALGNAHVQELATKFGIPTDQVLKLLAEHLPAAIDQASLNGTIKS